MLVYIFYLISCIKKHAYVCVFIDCTVSEHQLGCNMFLNDKCKFECFYDVPAPHNGLIGGLSLFTLCIVNMVLNSHISECRSGFCILASIKMLCFHFKLFSLLSFFKFYRTFTFFLNFKSNLSQVNKYTTLMRPVVMNDLMMVALILKNHRRLSWRW